MGKNLKGEKLDKGITQLKNGKYRVRCRISSDYEVDRDFSSLRSAKSFLDKVRYEVENEIPISDRSTTVNELFKLFIAYKESSDRAENTLRNYTNRYCFNVKDALGAKRIVDIKPLDIQSVLNDMKSDYMTSTIKQTYDTLRGLFWFAVSNDFIKESPVTKGDIVQIPKGEETKKIEVFSADEQKMFLQVAKDYEYYEQFAILLLTGLRISELVGLTWDCVDLDKRTIRVNKILEYRYDRRKDAELESNAEDKIRMRKTKDGKEVLADGWRWGKTKTTNSMRTIHISQQVVDILRQLESRPNLRDDTPEEFRDLVFLSKRDGLPVRTNTYDNAIRKRIDIMTDELNDGRRAKGLAEIEPKYLSCHDFRHTYATRFIESSKESNYTKVYKFLSRSLGHCSINITLDLYSHLTEESNDELVDDFSEYMSKFF